MTETQRVQSAQPAENSVIEQPEPTMPSRVVEVGDRSWTVVDLPDGESWNVHGTTDARGEWGPRLGHVTISERGYFSTDLVGTVRGPYTTLDEAVYPIGLDDPTLLDDPATQVQVALPAPIAPVHAPRPTERGRRTPLVAAAIVAAVAAAAVIGLIRRIHAGPTAHRRAARASRI